MELSSVNYASPLSHVSTDHDDGKEQELINGIQTLELQQKTGRSLHSFYQGDLESLVFLPGEDEDEKEKEHVNSKEAIEKWNLQIRRVNGDISKLSAAWQGQITKCGKNLRQLYLGETALSQPIMNNLAKSFPNLKELRCLSADDAALRELLPLKKLRVLTVLNCQDVTNEGVKVLADLTKLNSLELRGAKKITTGIKHLATLINLKVLIIVGSNPKKKEKRISDKHLLALNPLKKLERLEIGKCSIKKPYEIFVGLLEGLTELRVIHLHDPEIVTQDFLSKATKELEHPGIHKSVLRSIQAHRYFCEFNSLKFPKYDDKSFKEFVETLDINLTSLTVTGMQNVTNQGFQYLFQKKWTQLQEINLHNCYGLKDATQISRIIGWGITHKKQLQINLYRMNLNVLKCQQVIDDHIKVVLLRDDASMENFLQALKAHLVLTKEKSLLPQEESKTSVEKDEKKAKADPTVVEID